MSRESESEHRPDVSEPEHKKSLRRSWRTSGPVAKLTVVFAGIAAAATVVYAIVAIFQLVVMNHQLSEIRTGSVDTHTLAEAAKVQAAASLEQVNKLQAGIAQTHGLAVQAKNQADRTKEVAIQSLAQARSTHELAIQATKSAGIAEEQLRLSQMQFESSQRPWIVVKSVSALLFKWPPYMGALAFNLEPNITYTNIGNFPATGIRITQKMFFANENPGYDFLSDVKQRQKELCENQPQDSEDEDNVETLYPGHDGIYSPGLGINPPDLKQVRASDKIIAPVLVGCIFYRYLSSPTVHYTGFIFVIERKPKANEGAGQASYSLTYGEDVAAGDVVFAGGYNGNATYN